MKDTLYGRKVISTPSTSVPRPPTFQFNPQQPSNPTTNTPTIHHHPGSDSAELQYDVYHNFKYTNTPLILQQGRVYMTSLSPTIILSFSFSRCDRNTRTISAMDRENEDTTSDPSRSSGYGVAQ